MAVLPWTCMACRAASRTSLRLRAGHVSRRHLSQNSRFFQVTEEVQQAISEKRPVVALESTIYTHGFPYPDNLALASRLESLVRLNGGIPATIGILEGVARVGLAADELVRLVSSAGSASIRKVSRRDLGFVLGLKDADGKSLNGGTTVSGTMILAHMAGIRVFGTGGLGGVHRGAEQTMDVSADLTELGRTPVAVISSGCKSFLDIPKTLEYLETQGVAVATFADGRSGPVDFPAFYTRDSGVKSPVVLQDEMDAARVILAQHALGLQSGMHFANPIPEAHSVPFEQMEHSINQALKEALAAGATGAASTPFILAKIKELTGSKSVEANRALVESNVVRATKVASALRQLEESGFDGVKKPKQDSEIIIGPGAVNYTPDEVSRGVGGMVDKAAPVNDAQTSTRTRSPTEDEPASVFVAGSLAVDLSCDYNPKAGSSLSSPELHTSNPAQISQTLGGVGHNVARAAHLMGANVRLCSAVGDDLTGKAALEALAAANMSTTGIITLPSDSGSRTAQYVAINDTNKDLVLAMADMSILEEPSTLNETFDDFWLPQLQSSKPTHLVLDGNWDPEYLSRWLRAAAPKTHMTFEPVSTSKSTRLFSIPSLSAFPNPSIHLTTPNIHELASMHAAARETGLFDRADWWEIIDALGIPHTGARVQMSLATSPALVDAGVPQQSVQLLPFIPTILTKLGKDGVLLTQLLAANDPRLSSGEYAPYILSRCANGTEDILGVGGVYMRLFPAVEQVNPEDIVSVNGVGDTFVGTLIAGMAKKGKEARVEEYIDLAQRAAVLTLKTRESVSPGLGTLGTLL